MEKVREHTRGKSRIRTYIRKKKNSLLPETDVDIKRIGKEKIEQTDLQQKIDLLKMADTSSLDPSKSAEISRKTYTTTSNKDQELIKAIKNPQAKLKEVQQRRKQFKKEVHSKKFKENKKKAKETGNVQALTAYETVEEIAEKV